MAETTPRNGQSDGQAEPVENGAVTAELRHLTGPARGRMALLSAAEHLVCLDAAGRAHVLAGSAPARGMQPVALLRRLDGGYALEVAGAAPVWINRHAVSEATLRHGDIVEFGEAGPLSRFELVDEAHEPRRTLPAIMDDAYAYLRASRLPVSERVPRAMGGLMDQFLHRTTLLFRLGVVLALLVVLGLAYGQWQTLEQLERDVAAGEARLASVAEALGETQALSASDLAALRDEVGSRLGTLEERWEAGARTIEAATPAIAFIEGAFGFRDPDSGKLLRQVVDAAGNPIITPFGRPLLSLEGDGPVAARSFTGTGVLVEGESGLLTNRHVALPWERDAASSFAVTQGLETEMLHFNVYFPGETVAVGARLLRASDSADLALLALDDDTGARPALTLAGDAVTIGAPVIVMGYPTGLNSMLARAGTAFIEALGETPLDIEMLTARLAEAGFIRPLATRGIVGQTSEAAVVFDADTTHGGSGGPVLSLDGRLVALQSAVIAGFGGSNFGVPAARIRAFLAGDDAG